LQEKFSVLGLAVAPKAGKGIVGLSVGKVCPAVSAEGCPGRKFSLRVNLLQL